MKNWEIVNLTLTVPIDIGRRFCKVKLIDLSESDPDSYREEDLTASKKEYQVFSIN